MEAAVRHGEALAIVEELHVQPKTTVGLKVDQVLVNCLLIERPAVRRQAHQFVLSAVDLESTVVREGRVEQSEGMRKLQMMGQADLVAFANSISGRAPLTDSIQ